MPSSYPLSQLLHRNRRMTQSNSSLAMTGADYTTENWKTCRIRSPWSRTKYCSFCSLKNKWRIFCSAEILGQSMRPSCQAVSPDQQVSRAHCRPGGITSSVSISNLRVQWPFLLSRSVVNWFWHWSFNSKYLEITNLPVVTLLVHRNAVICMVNDCKAGMSDTVSCLVFSRPHCEGWPHHERSFLHWCLSSTFVTSRANDMCLWCYVIYPRRLGSTSSRPIVSLFLNLISLSRQTPFILNMWPWYASFLSLIDASKLLATPAVSSTHSLVLVAVHNTLNTCLRHSFKSIDPSFVIFH